MCRHLVDVYSTEHLGDTIFSILNICAGKLGLKLFSKPLYTIHMICLEMNTWNGSIKKMNPQKKVSSSWNAWRLMMLIMRSARGRYWRTAGRGSSTKQPGCVTFFRRSFRSGGCTKVFCSGTICGWFSRKRACTSCWVHQEEVPHQVRLTFIYHDLMIVALFLETISIYYVFHEEKI